MMRGEQNHIRSIANISQGMLTSRMRRVTTSSVPLQLRTSQGAVAHSSATGIRPKTSRMRAYVMP